MKDRDLSIKSRGLVRSEAVEAIKAKTAAENPSTWDWVYSAPDYAWSTSFFVPFSMNASKNRRWCNNGQGAVFLTREIRRYQDEIIVMTREAMRGKTVKQNKLWLSFFVEKPNHRSDAINVIDTLCDAIKQAIELDDRWFCLDRVDWRIQKTDPAIFIKIGQESLSDIIICSHCGAGKGLDEFGFNSSLPLGKQRVCKPCKLTVDQFSTRKRRSLAAGQA